MPQQHFRIQHQAEPGEGYIRKLIAQGEHEQLDFKFGITDSRKIARTLSAFANTNGGRLLIGVKDNGAVAGVRSEEEFYMVQAAADLYTRPAVPFDVKEWTVEGKKVLEIIVPQVKGALCSAPEKEGERYLVYIREHDENFPVNKVWLTAYRWKNSNRDITVHYGETEKILLNHFTGNGTITLSEFCSLARISHKSAEHILAAFVSIGLMKVIFTHSGAHYGLSGTFLELTPDQREASLLDASA